MRDITARKEAENIMQTRLRITEFAAGHSLDKVLQNALDELCALTNSLIGFFHFVEPDQRTLSLQAWSTRTLEEMCTADTSLWNRIQGRAQPSPSGCAPIDALNGARQVLLHLSSCAARFSAFLRDGKGRGSNVHSHLR